LELNTKTTHWPVMKNIIQFWKLPVIVQLLLILFERWISIKTGKIILYRYPFKGRAVHAQLTKHHTVKTHWGVRSWKVSD
jgi:hypothetical protein